MASRETKELVKIRNQKIRTEFWQMYKELPGRHYSRIDIVAAQLSTQYFLSASWIKIIAGKYEPSTESND